MIPVSLFIELGILPLPCLFIYESVIFVKMTYLTEGTYFHAILIFYITTHQRRRNHVHQVQYQQLSTEINIQYMYVTLQRIAR